MKPTSLVLWLCTALLAEAGIACEEKIPEPSGGVRPEPVPSAKGDELKELVKEDVVVGKGREAKTGDTVRVKYTGRLLKTNAKFDSTEDNGGEPMEVKLGEGNVIKGWDQGIPGMKVGGKRKLKIPADLAYGKDGQDPKIPANAALVFDVELVEIVGAEPASADSGAASASASASAAPKSSASAAPSAAPAPKPAEKPADKPKPKDE